MVCSLARRWKGSYTISDGSTGGGASALYIAARDGHDSQVIKLLIEAHADVNLTEDVSERFRRHSEHRRLVVARPSPLGVYLDSSLTCIVVASV